MTKSRAPKKAARKPRVKPTAGKRAAKKPRKTANPANPANPAKPAKTSRRRERPLQKWKIAAVAAAVHGATGAVLTPALAARLASHPDVHVKPLPDKNATICCYLLESLTPYKGGGYATYIGYSTNPDKRLRKHNGELAGGAKYTTLRGPWRRVALVGGFRSKVEAMQFEKRWQMPHKFAELKKLSFGPGAATSAAYKRRVAQALIASARWAPARFV